MDSNECQTLIAAARGGAGKSLRRICDDIDAAGVQFKQAVRKRFSRHGEW
jgi:hypothetical protein